MKEKCNDDLTFRPWLHEVGSSLDLFIAPDDGPGLKEAWNTLEADVGRNDDNLIHTIKLKLDPSKEVEEFISELSGCVINVEGHFGELVNGVIDEHEETITFEWVAENPNSNIHEDWNIAT